MVDLIGTGLSFYLSAFALIGGLIGSGIFYYLDKVEHSNEKWSKIINFITLIIMIVGFFLIFALFVVLGNIYTDAGKTQNQQEINVTFSLSCSKDMNCTGSMRNNDQIVAQPTNAQNQTKFCIQPKCPEQTNSLKNNSCPPILSLPKFN
jgi:phosphate/sulfate permease